MFSLLLDCNSVEQRVDLPVILEAMTLIWPHHNLLFLSLGTAAVYIVSWPQQA